MSETTGREFDARRETELGVTRELRVGGAILQEVFCREVAFQRCEEVLCRDAVPWAGTSTGEQPWNKEDDKPASSKTIG
jgi:hypothetical protein